MPIDLFEKLEILISLRIDTFQTFMQSNLLSERKKIDLKNNVIIFGDLILRILAAVLQLL